MIRKIVIFPRPTVLSLPVQNAPYCAVQYGYEGDEFPNPDLIKAARKNHDSISKLCHRTAAKLSAQKKSLALAPIRAEQREARRVEKSMRRFDPVI